MLVQDQADAMRHNPQEVNAAYERVAVEGTLELEEMTRVPMRTTEEIQAILDDLARTEIEPRYFDELSIALAWSLRAHRDVI